MKIRIDVDITAEETRKLMGLPDVETFNRELMDGMLERMKAGAEGYDPLTLFQPYLSQTMAGMETFRKVMGAAMGGFKTPDRKEGE
jgi:hypothetical protein